MSAKVVRVVITGAITGALWFLLSAISLLLIGSDLLTSIESARQFERWPGSTYLFIDFLMGTWAISLFTLIRGKFKSPRTASIVCASFWWLMKTLESCKWLGLGILPAFSVVGLAVTTLISMFLATLFGAWLYDRMDPMPEVPIA